MSNFKRFTRLLAGAILTTGIFAGSVAAPASAAPHESALHAKVANLDTGWGP
jgi:hypothetical protein